MALLLACNDPTSMERTYPGRTEEQLGCSDSTMDYSARVQLPPREVEPSCAQEEQQALRRKSFVEEGAIASIPASSGDCCVVVDWPFDASCSQFCAVCSDI